MAQCRVIGAALLLVCAACLLQQSYAIVTLPYLTPYTFEWQPPVTRWLLPTDPRILPPSQQLAWRKIGELQLVVEHCK